MGKREALLIAAFVLAGVVVYQLTAAPGESGEGFSFGRILDKLRTEIRADSASGEVTNETTHALPAGTRELGITGVPQIEIIGEDRQDILSQFTVRSTGPDQAQAEALARRSAVVMRSAGEVTKLGLDYPVEGRQRPLRLVLRVPRRLRIRLEATGGRAEIGSVAEVHLFTTRGGLSFKGVGVVKGDHRSGTIDIEDARDIRITSNGTRLRLDKVGTLGLELTSGGVQITNATGPIEINARNTEIEVAAPDAPVRIGASGGEVKVSGVRNTLRIDGRDTEVSIRMTTPAAITAFTSNAPIELVEPSSGGFTLDAVAADGQIAVPDQQLPVTGDDAERRATGNVRGGGPTVSLRTSGGTITIRKSS